MGPGFGLTDLTAIDPERKSRSITPENPTGEVGAGGKDVTFTGVLPGDRNHVGPDGDYSGLGPTRKARPCMPIPTGETTDLAEIDGPGVINHIWMAAPQSPTESEEENVLRDLVLEMYWDDEEDPSVAVPLGDFFCNGFGLYANFSSLPITVLSKGGMNCYFQMPFRESARIAIRCEHPVDVERLFYQIDYDLVPALEENVGYFHAQWRRENPTTTTQDYVLLDDVEGQGHYVGTYFAWTALEPFWWGEGEMKFYIDGDDEYPTICGTGAEDYIGGAWGFKDGTQTSPFLGYLLEESGDSSRIRDQYARHGVYRWHIQDPIRFSEDLRVTIQQIGHNGQALFERCDDVASTVYWYQREPHCSFPELPTREERLPGHRTVPDLPDQRERLGR